jgi:hypothetical protein
MEMKPEYTALILTGLAVAGVMLYLWFKKPGVPPAPGVPSAKIGEIRVE